MADILGKNFTKNVPTLSLFRTERTDLCLDQRHEGISSPDSFQTALRFSEMIEQKML